MGLGHVRVREWWLWVLSATWQGQVRLGTQVSLAGVPLRSHACFQKPDKEERSHFCLPALCEGQERPRVLLDCPEFVGHDANK